MGIPNYKILYKEAVDLRSQDLDIHGISVVLGLSESTVYGWLRQNKKPNRAYSIPLQIKSKLLSPSLSYIFGVMKGDGDIVNNDKIRLRSTDRDFVEAFKNNIEKWVGFPTSRVYSGKNNGSVSKKLIWTVVLSSKDAAKFLQTMKFRKIGSSNNENKISFLRGIFDSEGSVTASRLDDHRFSTRKVRIYSTDKPLLTFVSRLLKDFRIESRMYLQPRTKTHIGKKEVYVVQISNRRNLEIFYRHIGFNIKRKQEKLTKIVESYWKAFRTRIPSS